MQAEGTAVLRSGRDRGSVAASRDGEGRTGVRGRRWRKGPARFCGPDWRIYFYPERKKKSLEGFEEEGGSVMLAF